MARDTQRKKLYRAEQTAERRLLREEMLSDGRIAPRNPRLTDEEVLDLVERATEGKVRVQFVNDRPKPKFNHDKTILMLPQWARAPLPILHQLAHALTPSTFPDHGAEFIEQELILFGAFVDPHVADVFRHAYVLEGIQVDPSPKQARRFLPYCRKEVVAGRHDPMIRVITRTAELIVSQFIDFDGASNTLTLEDRMVPVSDLRYASWAT